MNNSNILTVLNVSDIKEDKNNRKFKTVTLVTPSEREVTVAAIGKVIAKVAPKTAKINVWEKSYLDGNQQFGFDLKKGDVVLGDVVTMQVEPYDIPNTKTGEVITVNKYSCAVLGDSASASWNSEINRVFASNDKIIDVNLVAPMPVTVPFETAK